MKENRNEQGIEAEFQECPHLVGQSDRAGGRSIGEEKAGPKDTRKKQLLGTVSKSLSSHKKLREVKPDWPPWSWPLGSFSCLREADEEWGNPLRKEEKGYRGLKGSNVSLLLTPPPQRKAYVHEPLGSRDLGEGWGHVGRALG